jgi:hypothetical protein
LSYLVGMMMGMTTQLRLIDPSEVDWRLDERTKAIGRQGIERARAALRAARAPLPGDASTPTGTEHPNAA